MTTESKKTRNLSEIARNLEISRQAVSKLIRFRERTGAPEPDADGLYDIDEFKNWYANVFSPKGGPRRGIRAR